MKKVTENLVSVVIPTFNRVGFARRAVQSCLQQTHPDLEIIVIDDGSTDGTREEIILMAERARGKIRYVRQEHKGPCAARNMGLDLVRGEYIQLLDDDDLLSPEKFAIQVAAMRDTRYQAAVSDFQYIQEEPVKGIAKIVDNSGDLKLRLCRFTSIFYGSVLMRSTSVPEGLRYSTSLPCYQDIDFMFRYFLGIDRWIHTPGPLVHYVQHQGKRISDRYRTEAPFVAMRSIALGYWERNRYLVPRSNLWMLGGYTISLSQQLLRKGLLREAVRCSRSSLAGSMPLYSRYKGLRVLAVGTFRLGMSALGLYPPPRNYFH